MPRKRESIPETSGDGGGDHRAARRRRLADRRTRRKQAGADKARTDAARQPDESDPHVDENLDAGLEETFPASDPVSISRGAD